MIPRSRPSLLIALTLAALTGCVSRPEAEPAIDETPAQARLERARDVVRAAESAAAGGDLRRAIETVLRGYPGDLATEKHLREVLAAGRPEAALDTILADENAVPGAKALLVFTLAWLYADLAGAEPDDRVGHLSRSARCYRSVLDFDPLHANANLNLALVLGDLGREREALARLATLDFDAIPEGTRHSLRLVQGDLRFGLFLGERNAVDAGLALEAYDRARAQRTGDRSAALRIVRVYDEVSPDELAGLDLSLRDLLVACDGFVEHGLAPIALTGLEVIARKLSATGTLDPLAKDSIQRWVEISAGANALSLASLGRLPNPRRWPEPVLVEVVALTWVSSPETLAHRRSVQVASRLLTGAALPSWATPGLGAWTSTSEGRRIIARALQSLGQDTALAGHAAEASRIYARAMQIVMEPEDDDARDIADEFLSVWVDIGLDRLILYHVNPKLREAEEDEYIALAERVAPDEESFDGDIRPRITEEERHRFHTVLGLIYAEEHRWVRDDWRAAPRQLELAIASATEPQPHLWRILGRGFAESGLPADSLDAYHAATRGYLELGSEREARGALADANEVFDAFSTVIEDGIEVIEREIYPVSRWYVGGAFGLTEVGGSSGDVEDDLARFGHRTDVDLDDSSEGAKVYVGYRFDGPFAVEAGFVSLGEMTSTVTEIAPIVPDLVDHTGDVHPGTGRGIAVSLVGIPYETRKFAATARLGVWSWESDVEVAVGAETLDIERDGTDVFYGVGAQYRIDYRARMVIELERYQLDDDEVDFLSIGLQYRF